MTQNIVIVRAALRQFTWVQSAHYSLHTLLEKKKLASDWGKRKQSIEINHRLMCFNPLLKYILRRCETRLMRETPLHQYDWGRAAEEHDWSVLSPHCTSCLWVAQWGWHGCHLSDTDYFIGWSRLMFRSTHVSRYKDWLQVSLRHLPGVLCTRSSKTSMNSSTWHSLTTVSVASQSHRERAHNQWTAHTFMSGLCLFSQFMNPSKNIC